MLAVYQTKGGKYKITIEAIENGFKIVDYTNERSVGTEYLYNTSENEALKVLDKKVKERAYFDNVNYIKVA